MNNQNQDMDAIYDAKKLGPVKAGLLGFQHLFAMFGATVLVPTLTGLSVSSTLLFAGLGTLLFHLLSKGKVPAFLGSSFAFLAGYFAIAPNGERELLPYACFGVFLSGFMYVILAFFIKIGGVKRVMRYFPPIVTGPIIISIGLSLSGSAITNASSNWGIAVVAVFLVVLCNIWGKGMIKIIPILVGTFGSYLVAALSGNVDFSNVASAKWIGLPFEFQDTVFGLLSGDFDSGLLITAALTIVPLAIATMVEHIGDICAISSTCSQNFIEDPGLHRTLLGDGLATSLAALFGAPANTTYVENTGVLVLTKVYDPMVIRIAAVLAILLSFCPKFSELIKSMPQATIGGVSLILYGMISAVGVRNVVENKVNFTNSRNVIIAALILVLAIGISYTGNVEVMLGSVTVSFGGLAVASIVGIILNALLPGKDYEFGVDLQGDTSVNFKV